MNVAGFVPVWRGYVSSNSKCIEGRVGGKSVYFPHVLEIHEGFFVERILFCLCHFLGRGGQWASSDKLYRFQKSLRGGRLMGSEGRVGRLKGFTTAVTVTCLL